jgi:hypothetical protein
MHIDKASDVVETAGMKELHRVLTALGMVYDMGARRWILPATASTMQLHRTQMAP